MSHTKSVQNEYMTPIRDDIHNAYMNELYAVGDEKT